MKNIKSLRNKLAIAAAFALMTVSSQAAVDTNITAMLTDVDTVFTVVKGAVIGIAAFFIVLGIAKKVKRA